MLTFTGERIVPEADNCEPLFALKMYQEHIARYLFASQKAAGKSVLDIGCGVGYGSQLIARSGALGVTAFDISKEAIGHAQQFYPHPNLQFDVASAEDFAFSKQFDLIICFELIEHLHHQHQAIERIASALTFDGLLFISTPQPRRGARSAFHARELSHLDFSNLLSCYFPYVEWFFENNHFASLVAGSSPVAISEIHPLHPQFGLGQADYFVAVASRSPIDRSSFKDQLVLNNDSYVRNLEKDVNILHEIEHDLKTQISSLAQERDSAVDQSRSDKSVREDLELQLRALAQERDLAVSQLQTGEMARKDLDAQLHALARQRERDVEQRRSDEAAYIELSSPESAVSSASLEQLTAKISYLEQELEGARNREAAALHNSETLQAEIADLNGQAEIRQAQVSEVLAEVEDLKRLVPLLQSNSSALGEQLRTQERGALRWKKQVVQAEGESKRQNEIRKQESAALIADLVGVREQLSTSENSRIGLESELQRLRVDLSQAQAKAQSYQLRFNALVSSRSWQLTNPLRKFATAIRGHAHDPFGIAHVANGNETESLGFADPAPVTVPNPEQVRNGDNFHIPSRPRFDVLYIIGCHDGESKRYRAHNLTEGLTELGYRAEYWPQDEIPRMLEELFSARVVVLFRCAYDENIGQLLRYCKANEIESIFDVDDLVVEPENIDLVRVLKEFTPSDRAAYLTGVERFQKTLKQCDRATCTTAFLAKRIESLGKRADVIPNSLNDHQLEIARGVTSRVRKRDEIRIGYFSGSNTHQVDFESCEVALLTIMDRHPDVRFVLVGILNLDSQWDRFSHRVERHGFMPYKRMLALLAETDINLAPLELGNPYCESKSQLKIFEAGLVEVPTVASATESYSEAIDHGQDGFLADGTAGWLNALEALIESPDLRRTMAGRARERALSQFGPHAVLRQAVKVYGLPDQQAGELKPNDVQLKITWIIPDLQIGSGGHRNILRAAYFLEQFGHQLELYFTNTKFDADELKHLVRKHFYPLECPMHVYAGDIDATDVLFATHWTTVDAAVRARNVARQLMYFVQDFEPAFAPMGTEYILAENTYRLGLYHITSGPWCENLLKKDFGVEADHFVFPVDRKIYHPRGRTRHNRNVVFFARPEMPRRCFELGVLALEQFHHLRPDVEIILFGSQHIAGFPVPFPATVHALLPTIDDLAQLYANADLGIVFSTTNPSLVPYEMMACGLPVVDLGRPGNEVNYGGGHDVALLADPAPAIMAGQIRDLIEHPDQLLARSRKGLEFVQTFPSEEEMARRVEELILKRMVKSERAMAAGR